MEVQNDFKELLELFNKHRVEYLIVGGYAIAFHGAPRYTGDIDILVKAEHRNAEKIISALDDFGFGSLGLQPADFEKPGMIVQLGVAPVRIDIVTSITGVSWESAYSNRVKGIYGDIAVDYLGREEMIANKRAIGRKKDLTDIEAIGED